MVLKSSNLKVWLEMPSSKLDPITQTPIYTPLETHSSYKTHQQILPTHRLRVQEAYVESHPGQCYAVALRVAPHWRNFGVQIIIDGVEQGNYISFNRFTTRESQITGRRVTRNSIRAFQFGDLRAEDGYGNYIFDENAHCKGGFIKNNILCGDIEPIEFMVGQRAVGSVRVNVYRVGRVFVGGECPGQGDWNPCTAVDDIGALKMQVGVESITTLGNQVKCSPVNLVFAEFKDRYPFETFLLKYRPHSYLANDNCLVAKQNGLKNFFVYIASWFKSSKKEERPQWKFHEKMPARGDF
ncbi:hypothetical protein AA313_de0209100 [Arthrobotrys entomopaga]|nr:hypothetical protein AA313_de0209100 [Arthrobotrys entomopaga]